MKRQQTSRRRSETDRTLPANSFKGTLAELRDRVTNPAPGEPMDATARRILEPRFGHSFADVQIHADAEAESLCRSLSAAAFTIGQDIYFRPAQYQPASPAGLHLLAHEAAHTVQQEKSPTA